MTDRLAVPLTARRAERAGRCPRCGRWVTAGAVTIQLAAGAFACSQCALALAGDADTRKQVLGHDPAATRRVSRAELETAACIIAARLAITVGEARDIAAMLTPAGRRPVNRPAVSALAWLARTMPDDELRALRQEATP